LESRAVTTRQAFGTHPHSPTPFQDIIAPPFPTHACVESKFHVPVLVLFLPHSNRPRLWARSGAGLGGSGIGQPSTGAARPPVLSHHTVPIRLSLEFYLAGLQAGMPSSSAVVAAQRQPDFSVFRFLLSFFSFFLSFFLAAATQRRRPSGGGPAAAAQRQPDFSVARFLLSFFLSCGGGLAAAFNNRHFNSVIATFI
jgi:hypothetical protein